MGKDTRPGPEVIEFAGKSQTKKSPREAGRGSCRKCCLLALAILLVEISGAAGAGLADGLDRDLQSINGVDEIERRSHGWFLRCTKDVRPEVVSMVTGKKLPLLQLRSEDPTLEEIYLKYFREA